MDNKNQFFPFGLQIFNMLHQLHIASVSNGIFNTFLNWHAKRPTEKILDNFQCISNEMEWFLCDKVSIKVRQSIFDLCICLKKKKKICFCNQNQSTHFRIHDLWHKTERKVYPLWIIQPQNENQSFFFVVSYFMRFFFEFNAYATKWFVLHK